MMAVLLSHLLPCLVVLLLSRVAGQSTVTVADVPSASSSPSSPLATPPSSLLVDTQLTEDSIAELSKSLRFEPPQLNFGESSVGTARSYTVTLINQNAKAVYLSSVSGRKSAFYSSFFEAKVVPPQGNTTFSVVFLPREQGAISSDLLIHTSFGLARLAVSGEGRECPYRLKPIVGIKAPLNATLTPEIHMYNPHDRPLQILEIYSSGGQFQLELPSGGQEGPQTLWQIPAHTSKPIIRIRFHGRTAGNYTAYIRIKIATEHSVEFSNTSQDNVLVIPVEFEVLPEAGAYADNPVIDFGRLTTESNIPVHLKLNVHNSNERRSFDLIGFDMRRIPGLSFSMSELRFTLDAQQFLETTLLQEVVVLHMAAKRNASLVQNFSVLVYAEVFRGTLYYNQNVTKFVKSLESDVRHGDLRRLLVRNDFDTSLTLWGVELPHDDHASVASALDVQINKTAVNGLVLLPGKKVEILQLQVRNDNQTLKSHIRVFTNVTNIDIPLVVCSGLLHVSTNHEPGRVLLNADYSTVLNLGAIPLAEMSHDGYVVLRNPNPLAIKLNNWNFNSPRDVYFHTTFMGCLKHAVLQEMHNESLKIDSSKFHFCSHLGENDVAVFQVAIQSYMTDQSAGSLKIWTGYETITIVVKFRTWRGKLEVDQEKLYFRNCFPGKLCVSDLSIRSTFQHPIHVTSINFTDAGIRFMDFEPRGSVIAPEAVTKIGRIYFEPSQLCQNRCYIPPEEDRAGALLAFPPPLANKRAVVQPNLRFDETELRRRTEMYRHLRWHFQTISFTLNSEEVKQFLLQLIIDIEWPKLVPGKPAQPTVEAGQHELMSVVISNPADHPILVDYFLSDPEFAGDTQLSLPPEVVDISTYCFLTNKRVFAMMEKPLKQPRLLRPHDSLTVHVLFKAHETGNYCTLLHIRNNLTLYEAVWLQAKTVQSKFRFGNRKPGCETPLLFELNDKHYSGCANSDSRVSHEALVTTKRTFTARNWGEIPIYVDSFYIGNQRCEGYGFKVLDCQSFELKTNASKRIEIAFSPDFTMVRVVRPLVVKTNLSYDVSYQLMAQLATGGLDQCIKALPRPSWEGFIRNVSLTMLILMFVFVVVAAHIDFTNIIVTQSALYVSREKGQVQPTFNLRNIGLRTQQAALAIDAWGDASTDAGDETSSKPATTTTATTHQSRTNNRSNGCCHQKSNQSQTRGSGGSTIRKRPINRKVSNKLNEMIAIGPEVVGIGRDMTLSPDGQEVTTVEDLGKLMGCSFTTMETITVPPCPPEGTENFLIHAMMHNLENFKRKYEENIKNNTNGAMEATVLPIGDITNASDTSCVQSNGNALEGDVVSAVAGRGKKKQRIQKKINKVMEGSEKVSTETAPAASIAETTTKPSAEVTEIEIDENVDKPAGEADAHADLPDASAVAESAESLEATNKKLGKRERRRKASQLRNQSSPSTASTSSSSGTSSMVSLGLGAASAPTSSAACSSQSSSCSSSGSTVSSTCNGPATSMPKSKRAMRKLKAEQRRLSMTASPHTDDDNNNKPSDSKTTSTTPGIQKVHAVKGGQIKQNVNNKRKMSQHKDPGLKMDTHGQTASTNEEEHKDEAMPMHDGEAVEFKINSVESAEQHLTQIFDAVDEDAKTPEAVATSSLTASSECSAESPINGATPSSPATPRSRSPATARSAQGSPSAPTPSMATAPSSADDTPIRDVEPPLAETQPAAPLVELLSTEAVSTAMAAEAPTGTRDSDTGSMQTPLLEMAVLLEALTTPADMPLSSTAIATTSDIVAATYGGFQTGAGQASPSIELPSALVETKRVMGETKSSMELGPIGSRKSPSSTPVWESIVSNAAAAANGMGHVQKPTTTTLSNNSSFFSNVNLPAQHYGPFEGPQGYLDLTTPPGTSAAAATSAALYELKKANEELQYMINLQQQQHQLQAHLMGSADVTNRNWAATLNAPAWSPMGYPNGANLPPPNNVSTQYQGLPGWQTLPTANLSSPAANLGAVRPPPGLESNYLSSQAGSAAALQQHMQQHTPNPLALHQQQQQQQRSTLQQQQQHQQQQFQPNVHAHVAGQHYLQHLAHIQAQNANPNGHHLSQQHAVAGGTHQLHNQQQQHQQQRSLMNLAHSNGDDILPFDPFSSLSSIWSDDWLNSARTSTDSNRSSSGGNTTTTTSNPSGSLNSSGSSNGGGAVNQNNNNQFNSKNI